MHTVQAPADKKRRKAAKATVVSLSAAEVDAAVEREGLTLVQSADNKTGYQSVSADGHRFRVQSYSGNKRSLGTFDSALEAALCVARFLGPDASAAAAAGLGLVAQGSHSESDHCSLMLGAPPAAHTQSLSAARRSAL